MDIFELSNGELLNCNSICFVEEQPEPDSDVFIHLENGLKRSVCGEDYEIIKKHLTRRFHLKYMIIPLVLVIGVTIGYGVVKQPQIVAQCQELIRMVNEGS